MACNNWIPSRLTLNADKIPIEDRISYMVCNSLQPIPEHKFETLYFYLFNESFKPSLFGRYSNVTEIIASKPNLYRTISSDGRAYIHHNNSNNNNDNHYKHKIPQWSIKPLNKTNIFGKMSIIFKIYRENKYIRDIDLIETLFNDNNKLFITFGRDNNCDFCIQHVSISRKHSIFQFANDGTLFVYDISTHGILINNKNIPKKKYVECKNNDKIRFGHSRRIYHLFIDRHGKIKTNKKNISDEKTEELIVKNKVGNNKNKMTQMQKTIDRLTMDLNAAQKTITNQSSKVISLMEQMECLKVTNSNINRIQQKHEEYEDESENEQSGVDEKKRVSKINGINFLKEINNLSNLTVVKLRYYTDKNDINVGRVKKSKLVKIIKKDIQNHFDV